ncbi:MAG: hypothetical protein WBX25_25845, partial [Rhodomicrobium sp.]
MTAASRSQATAPLEARLASGSLPLSYTTTGDVTPKRAAFRNIVDDLIGDSDGRLDPQDMIAKMAEV